MRQKVLVRRDNRNEKCKLRSNRKSKAQINKERNKGRGYKLDVISDKREILNDNDMKVNNKKWNKNNVIKENKG